MKRKRKKKKDFPPNYTFEMDREIVLRNLKASDHEPIEKKRYNFLHCAL